MTTFAENMDSLMTQRGMSLHRLARAVHYDVGYLCKIKNGQKPPSRWMATLVDDALSVDGSLIALAPSPNGNRSQHTSQPNQRPAPPDAVTPADAVTPHGNPTQARVRPAVPPSQFTADGIDHENDPEALAGSRP